MEDKKEQGKVRLLMSKSIVAAVVVVLMIISTLVLYWNHMLNMINRPVPEETAEMTQETEPSIPVTTSPEETWPKVISDKNITNIMLVGQAARKGETAKIADTMILCSINRERKTLTLTSIMRDLRLVWPEFLDAKGKPHYGHNRINMAYNMGNKWRGDPTGGMDLLASIVEHNFGVHVDHSVEVNFNAFRNIVDLLGGVTVNLTQAEYDYMEKNAGWLKEEGVVVGETRLNGYHALCYARMRKVGHGDYERTERQRRLITQIIGKLRELNILEIHEMFTSVLPMITTDMSNQEITNYAFELIPMLKYLEIQSQRIPFEGTYWGVSVDMGTYMDSQIDCNAKENGRLLRESIGMEDNTLEA